MQFPLIVLENGRKEVATIGDRLPRMRCIGKTAYRPGPPLWGSHIALQASEFAVRVGIINRMADLARPQSVHIA
ncbi:MAG: hypothetical protein E5299_00184 [Burkholderia gladioli]|nr:MAG: hypothetical protein E5299_00184 [Burkholderia gladioli]